MRSTTQFVLFIALAAFTFAAINPVYHVTSGLEDYTLLVGRQMQNELDIFELHIATVKARHTDRIDSITNQQLLVLQEIQQFDNNLVQQQAFSLIRKRCVQYYKPRLPTLKLSHKNFTYCLTDAETSGEGLTESAEITLKTARNIREIEVPEIFNICNQTHSTNNSALESCVIVQIDKEVGEFNAAIDDIRIILKESIYKSNVIATEATRCSFAVEKNVLTRNGAISDLTDICVEDLKQNGAWGNANRNANESKLMQKLMTRNYLFK